MTHFANAKKLDNAIVSLLHNLKDSGEPETNHDLNNNWSKSDHKIFIPEGDGLLAVKKGRLALTPPKSGGRSSWPKIYPGENVTLKMSGREINGIAVLQDVDDLVIEIEHQPAESKFELLLSLDLTKVIMETQFITGKKFSLQDAEATNSLTVEVIQVEELTPKPIEESMVYDKLEKLDVKVEIKKEAVFMACNSLKNSQTTVALGYPMVPPIDGWVEYLFKNEEPIWSPNLGDERVDFFDRGEINSVEEGEVLAICHPPIPGKTGLTVTGHLIHPPEPKSPQIMVGKGVKLADDGRAAMATTIGRPRLSGSKKKVEVISELVVIGDVDINNGHINFKGDVIISGNVAEGLEVKSGGQVRVMGNVLHAKVYGERGVFINKNLIGSFVRAGGEAAKYRRMLPLIKKIELDLEKVVLAFNQLKSNKRFSTEDLKVNGEGSLIKLILEIRFPQLVKNIKQLLELKISDGEQEENAGIWQVFELIKSRLAVLGPLQIKSISEVEKFYKFLVEVTEAINDSLDFPADVKISYCQNSQVEASGNVVIARKGIYHSTIYAGGEITVNGFCRGGELHGESKIVIKELGSETGAQTFAGVGEKGKIKAELVYPNVTLRIGTRMRKNQDFLKQVELNYLNEFIQESS